MNRDFNKNKIALIIGGVLVVLGLWQLAQFLFGAFFSAFWRIAGLVFGILGPLVIISIGVMVVVLARTGKLSLPKDRKLFRSTRNRKLAGVCGGIAAYLNVSPAAVRVATLVFGIGCWYVFVPLYLLFWVIIPPDTQSFNTWL